MNIILIYILWKWWNKKPEHVPESNIDKEQEIHAK